ncbi:histone-lysine N-methyltransferase SETMAR [Trichonephila clavipes]|nr:histone-lysine N-methyltransferase SETMAR [Trichonephila clavipes]
MLVRFHEDQELSMKCMYEWFARFREGRKSVSDKTRQEERQLPSVTKTLRKVRIQYAQQCSWFFVQDNAQLTQPISKNSFWQKKRVVQIEHSPYSPDLNPPDFFLFRRLKLALKGKKPDDILDIQRKVKRGF